MAEQNLLLYRVLGRLSDGYELSFRLNGTDIGKAAKVDIFLHYKNKCLNNTNYKNINCWNKICWASYIAPKFTKKITYCVPSFSLKKENTFKRCIIYTCMRREKEKKINFSDFTKLKQQSTIKYKQQQQQHNNTNRNNTEKNKNSFVI